MKIETRIDKTYGLLLSGGLDSAILLYLLIKDNPKINLTIFTIPKHDGSALYAVPMVEHFNKKFNLSIPSPIFVGNPDAHHTEQSTTAIVEIFAKNFVDFLFMGVNTNPPELTDLDGAPKRKLTSPSPKLLYPFAHMLKDEIIKIMFDESQEDLMNITHSCTEQQLGRCNRCWQCTERAWAFRQLDKQDTGTL
jgi:hypothetical protein